MKTKWIAALVSVVTLGLVMAPIAPAVKGSPVQDGVVHACLKTKGKKSLRGTIRIVAGPRQCKKRKGEKALAWSLFGPTAGATGAPGDSGRPGRRAPRERPARPAPPALPGRPALKAPKARLAPRVEKARRQRSKTNSKK